MSEPDGSSLPWTGIRRSAASAASMDPDDLEAWRSSDPIESLRDGMALCANPWMYVFVFMLENASRRAEDDPLKAYWVPLPCVAHGSVTAVDPETALLDHPSVVYRIEDGTLRLEDKVT